MKPGAIGFFLLLNLLLRGWFFYLENNGLTPEALRYPDETNYLIYGRELLEQGPAWLFTERALSGPPGHVIFLAGLGGSILAVKVLSLLLSTFTLLPVLAIARRLSLDQRSARVPTIAAVLFTLSVPLLRTAPTLLTEPPNTFFVTAALAMALRASDEGISERRRRARWLGAGALLGAATLFRMSTLLLPVGLMAFVAIAWVWPFVRRRLDWNGPSLLKGLAAFAIGTFLVVAPFIAKNGIGFGHWTLGMGSGALLYVGADPKTDGHEPFYSQYNFDTVEVTGDYTHVQPEGDRRLAAAARHEIARAPLGFFARRVQWPLRLFVGQPVDVFAPGDSLKSSFSLVGPRESLLSLWNLVWRATIAAFATASLVALWRTRAGFLVAGTVVYLLIVLLPLFVIPRFSIPVLPLLTAAAAAWFDGRSFRARSTLAVLAAAFVLVALVAGWRNVFPRRVDAADYAAHTVLASWPAAANETWRAKKTPAAVATGPEGQSVLCGPEGVTLDADAPLLQLENNQIVLLPLRARSSGNPVPLQLFWQVEGQPAFTEEHAATAATFMGGWTDVSFRIPAAPSAKLTHLRIDTGDRPGLAVQLRPARVTPTEQAAAAQSGPATTAAKWSCINDCQASAGDVFRTLGGDPYFSTAIDPLPLDSDVRVVVGVGVGVGETIATPEQATPASISGKLQWREPNQSRWPKKNHADFFLTAQEDWSLVRMNPSLYGGSKLWVGELGAVRLVLRCSSYKVLEIGTMKLVKDYRLVGAK